MALAIVGAQACSSSFSDCTDRYTCGSSGSGGEAGADAGDSGGTQSGEPTEAGATGNAEAGASGAAGKPPACLVDADCDDHDPCTDGDTCQDSVCVPGPSPCTNPDSANCDVICSNKSGKPQCTVLGQDTDGDHHLSASCKEAPGDDCDDTQATVYKGAPEICDGLDNDCNGLVDLYDGLPLAETATTLAALGHLATNPRIAWDPVSSLFGVAWAFATEGSTTESVAFAALDSTGKTVVAPRVVQAADGQILDARIAVGGGAFGILWAVDYTNGKHAVVFNRVSPAGAVNTTTLYPLPVGTNHGSSPRLTYTPAGNWLLAWLEYSTAATSVSTKASLVDSANTLVPQAQLIPIGYRYEFDFALNTKGLVTMDTSYSASSRSLSIGVRSPDLTTSLGYLPYPGDTNVSQPMATASSSNFLIAWNNGPDARAGILKPDGMIQCGPVALPFEPYGILAVGDTLGYLAVSGQTLVNITPNCTVTGILHGASYYANLPSDVGGNETTGYVIVSGSVDKATGATQVDVTAIGPGLCK